MGTDSQKEKSEVCLDLDRPSHGRIEVPGLGVSFFAIPDAVRLDNPKLMLWRERAATWGQGASKEQQALVCLGTQAERPRFPDGILDGVLGHSRNPSPVLSTRDLPCGNARGAPNRWHPRVSRRDRIRIEIAPRRIDTYSVGRCSLILNFKL
jgi:hypothetical protein